MNFLHNLRRFVFIFLASWCWIYLGFDLSASHSQELGRFYIQTCLPGTFTYINHYNSVVQGEEGFIFIGARNGILHYNGTSWDHIIAKGDVRLINNQGRVTGYSKNWLGPLSQMPDGSFEFFDSISVSGDITQVLSHKERMYILTSGGLFLLGKNGLSEIKPDHQPLRIFPSGKGIFILADGNVLFHHSEEQLEEIKIPGGINHLSHIQTLGDKTIFVDGINNNLLVKGPGGHETEFQQIAGFLSTNGFTCALRLSTGHFAFGTRRGGIIITAENGQVLTRISMSDGLYSNEIIQLLTDATDNLWALHENAASRIEVPSAFSYFNTGNGLEGNVKDVLRYKGEIFAASSSGLFRLHARENARFTRIKGIDADCRCLLYTPNSLIVGSNEGLYEIAGMQTRKIINAPVNVLHYETGGNVLLVGTDEGFRIFQPGGWKEIMNYSLPNVSIDDIAVSPAGFLWLSSRSGALYRSTKPFADASNLTYSSYTSEDLKSFIGSYVKLISAPGKLYFASLERFFTFDPIKQEFLPDSSLNLPFRYGSYRVGQIEEDKEQNLWISINHPDKRINNIWLSRPSSQEQYEARPLVYHRLDTKIINCLYAEPENTLWIGTHEGMLRYDPSFSRLGSPHFRTIISAIHAGNESKVTKVPGKEQLKLPNSNNRIRFEFLSTEYNSESAPLFQYRLKGLDEQWSDWNLNSSIEFRGLKKGKYEFFVRSQDLYGSISQTDTFQFRIKAPIYSSWYAFLVYLLVILGILYILQKWWNLQQLREQYHLEKIVRERTESLSKEKEKADDLIANILPKTTADELKLTGKVTSSKFKMCTVLFADIQGFTKIAEEMNPDKLIDQLDRFYFHFDSVVEKYNIEKIKTIGDAYMAAGGIPIKNRTNPVEVVLAALEMQHHMKELKESKTDIWDLRIGIHTGSVIAGVVGQKKYSYDIWGDSVNTASRMESSGEVGRVNISATTYKLIKDFFQCEFRGKMPVKYKGDIAMFFVNGLNPTFSEADRITPNAKFFIQIQLLRILDLEEFVIEKLEKELPEDLFFHNAGHTSHVYTQVELLGRGEKVSDEDLLLLRSAALLHDIGYIDRMDDHETRSVEYAREILPLYRYNEDQIEKICNLIMATTIPSEPQNLLEQIICDANLDYLGRVDFLIQSDKLFQEYRIRRKIKSKKDWNHYQINLLENHDFHTDIANRMREVPKEQQIENIRQFS